MKIQINCQALILNIASKLLGLYWTDDVRKIYKYRIFLKELSTLIINHLA